jgi:hypothetical protein
MVEFYERAPRLVATAAQIAQLQGATLEATILQQATPSLVETGYDGWNNGTTLFTLMLEVPIPTFAAVDEQREELEKSIRNRIAQIVRTEIGNAVTEVIISPALADELRPEEPPASHDVPAEDVPSFWEPGFFRLFITHIATNKAEAHRLKELLAAQQIAAFVAHDDIEPTKEWQSEIERALRTMDGLAALITPEFVMSRWCDQEVGIAIGRGKLVIPLRMGADPHGFLGKYQGLQVMGVDTALVAATILEILLQNPLSSPRMTDALIDRFAGSSSWASAKSNMTLVEKAPRLNTSQVARLVRSIEDNNQIGEAFGVPQRIRTLVGRIGQDVTNVT